MEAYIANISKDWQAITNRKRREFRANHPEEARANDARWRKGREAERNAYLKEWRAANHDELLKRRAAQREAERTAWALELRRRRNLSETERKALRRQQHRESYARHAEARREHARLKMAQRRRDDKEKVNRRKRELYTANSNSEEKVAIRRAAARRYKENNREKVRTKERDRKRAVRAAKKSKCNPSGSASQAADQVVASNDFLQFRCG